MKTQTGSSVWPLVSVGSYISVGVSIELQLTDRLYTCMPLTGSAAKGTGDLEVLQGNAIAAEVTGAVGKAADSVGEELENEEP